jgi:hypothetical protein
MIVNSFGVPLATSAVIICSLYMKLGWSEVIPRSKQMFLRRHNGFGGSNQAVDVLQVNIKK